MNKLSNKILNGDRVALSQVITLTESKLSSHQKEAQGILQEVENKKVARRIAISGPPGVGKSTLIEAIGLALLAQGRKVAVLAIDPTSSITGGSILGDRTRMEELSKSDNAFIRPSPSGDHLGGVASKTRESILLCEAAGFDDVLIETVGVGQSEYEARYLSDMMVLLGQAGSGDDLQGIKRGIMEMVDLVVVNKADGEMKLHAEQTKNYMEAALHLALADKNVPVLLTSALKNTGVLEVILEFDAFFKKNSKSINLIRQQQKSFWLKELYINRIRQFWMEEANSKHWKSVEQAVQKGEKSVWQGSSDLFKKLNK